MPEKARHCQLESSARRFGPSCRTRQQQECLTMHCWEWARDKIGVQVRYKDTGIERDSKGAKESKTEKGSLFKEEVKANCPFSRSRNIVSRSPDYPNRMRPFLNACLPSYYILYTPVRSSHYNPEYGLDEIVSGFGGARRAFGPLRQSVG
jgi:hypothetical protein